jgi:hypothetical protein
MKGGIRMTDQMNMLREFTDLINESRGKIVFNTAEGDRLVADSMLSALVGFATILSAAKTIPLTFSCDNKEDQLNLQAFFQKHHLLCQPA